MTQHRILFGVPGQALDLYAPPRAVQSEVEMQMPFSLQLPVAALPEQRPLTAARIGRGRTARRSEKCIMMSVGSEVLMTTSEVWQVKASSGN